MKVPGLVLPTESPAHWTQMDAFWVVQEAVEHLSVVLAATGGVTQALGDQRGWKALRMAAPSPQQRTPFQQLCRLLAKAKQLKRMAPPPQPLDRRYLKMTYHFEVRVILVLVAQTLLRGHRRSMPAVALLLPAAAAALFQVVAAVQTERIHGSHYKKAPPFHPS